MVRTCGPQSHLHKAGTPTMGGILILLSIVVGVILWSDLHNPYILFFIICDVRIWCDWLG
ncbi:MAG: hypothetical protein LRY69_01645 [Gammaproteobacteria bacterium]|nr:hypothetical protein [Gammaproteobacteria bacterium]